MNVTAKLIICISFLVMMGCVERPLQELEQVDLHEHFRGVNLSQAPRTTNWGDLPDFFEDRPLGSKSFYNHPKVVIIHDGFPGEILYRPDKELFVIQRDPFNSSTLTYFGPFKGDPLKVMKLNNPEIIK